MIQRFLATASGLDEGSDPHSLLKAIACMTFDLSALSLVELTAHRDAVAAAIAARKSMDRDAARRALEDRARTLGFSVGELFELTKGRRGRGKGTGAPVPARRGTVAATYAHPDDPSLIWSGRGRAPGWLAALEREDVARETLKIVRS